MSCFIGPVRRAIRHKTWDPRQGAIEWFPVKSQALCFSGELDNTQTIAVPGVSYVLALAQGDGKVFSSLRTRGVVSEVRESGRALRSAFSNTHAQRKQRGHIGKLKPHFNHSTFQKTSVSKQMGLG